jgi:hypothetical protein
MDIMVQVAPGELIDKITILEIKDERIKDEAKLKNVRVELDVLNQCVKDNIEMDDELVDLKSQLKTINEQLWVIEDDIRDCEREKDFGDKFVELARSVYFTNDKRAAIKKEINVKLNSLIVEEKSYQEY